MSIPNSKKIEKKKKNRTAYTSQLYFELTYFKWESIL